MEHRGRGNQTNMAECHLKTMMSEIQELARGARRCSRRVCNGTQAVHVCVEL